MADKILLLKYAIEYLSKYTSSKKNLERILKLKIQRMTKDKKERYDLYQSINFIFEQLEKNNLLSDEIYTSNKIQSLAMQGKSKNFIKQYLFSKGADKAIIEDQLNEFEEKNSNWEKESALIFIRKKKLLISKDDYEKKLAKMARAGFSYELSKEVLK